MTKFWGSSTSSLGRISWSSNWMNWTVPISFGYQRQLQFTWAEIEVNQSKALNSLQRISTSSYGANEETVPIPAVFFFFFFFFFFLFIYISRSSWSSLADKVKTTRNKTNNNNNSKIKRWIEGSHNGARAESRQQPTKRKKEKKQREQRRENWNRQNENWQEKNQKKKRRRRRRRKRKLLVVESRSSPAVNHDVQLTQLRRWKTGENNQRPRWTTFV